jgi:hypothetical protein
MFLVSFLCQLDDGLVGSYSKLHWGKRAYHQCRRPCKLAGWYLACWCCCTGGKRLSACHCVSVFLCLSLTTWRYTYVEVTCVKNVQIKWSLVYKVLKVPLSVSVSLLLHEDICGSYTCKALSKTSDLWLIGKALKINWIIKHVVEWQKVVFLGGHSLSEFVVMVLAGNPLNRRWWSETIRDCWTRVARMCIVCWWWVSGRRNQLIHHPHIVLPSPAFHLRKQFILQGEEGGVCLFLNLVSILVVSS